jgi:NAD(P)-dependent dehydrogenase (short-subunit alcohol dehydrogenase family)
MAVARRFASGGYRITLVARSTDGLRDLAETLADTGAEINTIAADASDPDGDFAAVRHSTSSSARPASGTATSSSSSRRSGTPRCRDGRSASPGGGRRR